MCASASPATQVGAHDAEARFSELLDRVESGEEIVITRHGRPVAKFSRTGLSHDAAGARAAVAALLALREVIAEEAGEPFSLAEILALRDEGRRY